MRHNSGYDDGIVLAVKDDSDSSRAAVCQHRAGGAGEMNRQHVGPRKLTDRAPREHPSVAADDWEQPIAAQSNVTRIDSVV